jgi:mRNA interferase MazF
MRRGEVWWANLPEPVGSGPGYQWPVLVVQSNDFNESRIATTLVAVITSNLALASAPGNLRLSKSHSGLDRASVVNVSQLVTLDRRLLGKRVKALPGDVMQRIDTGLRLVLGLS